jgi:pimeloyl-ACP methyl ester carboxylesterase
MRRRTAGTPFLERPRSRSRPAPALALAALAALLAASLGNGVARAGSAADREAPPAQAVRWVPCGGGLQCATAQVPLDYDQPHGRTITLALNRLPATDRAHRIGSLFVNPGGPGGSGVALVREAGRLLFPAAVRARFDIVGFDPRGVGSSTAVHCFATVAEQQAFFAKLPLFPVGPAEERAQVAASAQFARACAARNPVLLPHLSTANVARDLDLLRQGVGDTRLTFFGASYGSYLGETYANLFPDRVRALVLDGVVDPVQYSTGEGQVSRHTPVFPRLHSPQGSEDALTTFLRLCVAAGTRCPLAAGTVGLTRAKVDLVLARLLVRPLTVPSPQGNVRLTYALATGTTAGALYVPIAARLLAEALQDLFARADGTRLVALFRLLSPPPPDTRYDNTTDAQNAVLCVDADGPHAPDAYPKAAHRALRRAIHFGAYWTWATAACQSWPVRDADRYTGPWNRPTHAPLLLIGNTSDPATAYRSAVAASRELADARLLTLADYGHTSVTLSSCIERYRTAYLVEGRLPPRGTVCQPDRTPFAPVAGAPAGGAVGTVVRPRPSGWRG